MIKTTQVYLSNLAVLLALGARDGGQRGEWPFGALGCTLFFALETISKYASVMFITLLAFDRYAAVCR